MCITLPREVNTSVKVYACIGMYTCSGYVTTCCVCTDICSGYVSTEECYNREHRLSHWRSQVDYEQIKRCKVGNLSEENNGVFMGLYSRKKIYFFHFSSRSHDGRLSLYVKRKNDNQNIDPLKTPFELLITLADNSSFTAASYAVSDSALSIGGNLTLKFSQYMATITGVTVAQTASLI